MKQIILLFIAIILGSCQEDFPIYDKFCTTKKKSINCLSYDILMQDSDKIRVQNAFGFENNKSCEYRVQLLKYHIGDCNNPIVKSVGSDFNGYIRVTISKGMNCYYKVQSDFKDDENGAFERVLEKIEDNFKK